MTMLLPITCLILLAGVTYGWRSTSFFNEPFVPSYFDDDWFSLSAFDDFGDIMENTRQDFREMSKFSSAMFKANNDITENIKQKLNAVTPDCTTTENSPVATGTVLQGKQLRATNTTICIKDIVLDGVKYTSTETKLTDDKGNVISQNSRYGSSTSSSFSASSSSKTSP